MAAFPSMHCQSSKIFRKRLLSLSDISKLAFSREQQPEKEGAAQQGGEDPHRQLGRGHDGSSNRVADHQKRAAEEPGHRKQVAVVGADQRRQMCGTIRPTKPIGPQTATTAPTISETAKNSKSLVRPTLTPRLKANSSPVPTGSIRASDTRRPGSRKRRREDVPESVETDDAIQSAHHPAEHPERAGGVRHIVQEEDQAGEEELTATPARSIVAGAPLPAAGGHR